jgi:hypothetical protein
VVGNGVLGGIFGPKRDEISLRWRKLMKSFLICTPPGMFLGVQLSKINLVELGQGSQYRDRLWAGRPRGRSSCPSGGKNFHFSMSSRLVLGSTQPPIQWVPGALSPGGKATGA